jgi:transposase
MADLEGAMGHLFWLSDEAWAAIEPQLPKNQPGARRVDDRRVISGILHVLKSVAKPSGWLRRENFELPLVASAG